MRLKATISYDGTRFSGYQIQPNKRTVQGELEQALTKMHKGAYVKVTASGRTDQGVHAIGQVIHFDTNLEIPLDNWLRALNTMLPDDIEITDIVKVAADFHARYDATEKEYHYMIGNGRKRDIFQRHYSHFVKEPLDIKRMEEAFAYFIGTHDFTSFCAANSNIKGDKVRTITSISLEQQENKIVIRIKGTGFLYNMVRIIVGTLIEIGFGKRNPEDVVRMIEAGDRAEAGNTAPPQGLYLWKVWY